ncbi:MAG: YitT family protein [Roseburia sp.]|nr:YitT family protein [Roseburia sp.]
MQKLFYKRPAALDYIMIIIGTGLLGFSIQCVFDPSGLVIGGFTGFAIIVKEITQSLIPGGIPLWLTNIALNIPGFIIAFRLKGKRFVWRTIVGTAMLSVWLYIIPPMDFSQGDYILAAIFGGCIAGVGMGLVLLAKATTGGTDMVATLIQHYLKHYSIVQIMQVLDGLIVLCGLYVFGIRAALYAIVAIFITSKVSDMLMEGLKFSKAAYIITDRYELVAKRIMEELDRGITGLKAKGMYSGEDKCMLYCVVSQKEIIKVKEIVAQVDPHAFVIVSDAREVLGEGFQEYTK